MPAPAYVVGHITVKDPELWAEYRSRVPATLAPWQAELVFRGGNPTVLAGSHAHDAAVVIRFPDSAALAAWYRSAEYQALIPLRSAAADLDLIAFDGL